MVLVQYMGLSNANSRRKNETSPFLHYRRYLWRYIAPLLINKATKNHGRKQSSWSNWNWFFEKMVEFGIITECFEMSFVWNAWTTKKQALPRTRITLEREEGLYPGFSFVHFFLTKKTHFASEYLSFLGENPDFRPKIPEFCRKTEGFFWTWVLVQMHKKSLL